MSDLRNAGRQTVLVAEVPFTFATLAAGVNPAADLPGGARVVGGEVVVDTAWNDTTTATADVGDGDDDDRYSSTPVDLKVAGRTALTLTGYKYAASDAIDLTGAFGTGDSTQGAAVLYVQYIITDRAVEAG